MNEATQIFCFVTWVLAGTLSVAFIRWRQHAPVTALDLMGGAIGAPFFAAIVAFLVLAKIAEDFD